MTPLPRSTLSSMAYGELRNAILSARRAAALPARDGLVSRLRDLLAAQTALVAARDLAGYGDLDVSFHQEILEAAGNGRPRHVAENMIGQLRLGRATSARPSAALLEHAEIIAAIAGGQQHQAERLARRHVRKSANALDRHPNRGGKATA
jgi:DNA-binding GntR family transcriptional regulator